MCVDQTRERRESTRQSSTAASSKPAMTRRSGNRQKSSTTKEREFLETKDNLFDIALPDSVQVIIALLARQ